MKISKRVYDEITEGFDRQDLPIIPVEKVSVKRVIHQGYKEFELLRRDRLPLKQMFGKYQYMYSSGIGEISLICLKNYVGNGDVWEAYCLEGNLFDDVERFETKKKADTWCRNLLSKLEEEKK